MAIVALQGARQSARDAKRISDIKQMQIALELYYNTRGEYPESVTSSIEHDGIIYMAKTPTAPIPVDGDCQISDNGYSYSQTDAGSSYTIDFCLGGQIGGLSSGAKQAVPGGIISDNSNWTCGEMLSYQGYNYATVEIGSQCWFAENLKYIPDDKYFSSPSEVSAFCDYIGSCIWWCGDNVSCENQGGQWIDNNNQYYYVHGFIGGSIEEGKMQQNYIDYGVLYNWHAVDQEDLCPIGWRVATEGEFSILVDYLGGESVAGEKMRVVSWNGTNSSGFSALPGSGCGLFSNGSPGCFPDIHSAGYFWLSSSFNDFRAHAFSLVFSNVSINNSTKTTGRSVRCIKYN